MADIDISSYYKIGDTVKVIASGMERTGIIDRINAAALAIKVDGNTRPIFLTIKAIETIELVEPDLSTSIETNGDGETSDRHKNSLDHRSTESNERTNEDSLSTWYDRMEKESLIFQSFSPFDLKSANALVHDLKEKIDFRTYNELSQMLQKIKYALDMRETDDKFGRLQPIANKIIDIYLNNRAPKEILLIYTFLCRIRSTEDTNKPSLFTDGIETINRYNAEISEQALARDGSIPDALMVWKSFIYKPEILIYIINKGFRSDHEQFGILHFIRDMGHFTNPSTISSINGVYYALLKTKNPRMALEFAYFPQDSQHTKEELLRALETVFSHIAIQGFAYIHVTKFGKSHHLLTDDMEVFTFDKTVASSLYTGDYLNLLIDSESMEGTIVEFKSHDFTLKEYQSFIDKLTTQHEFLAKLSRKRLLFDFRITLKFPKTQPEKPHEQELPRYEQNDAYATLQKRKVKATTTKECLQVIRGLISIAENVDHPKRLTAVKDILEIYGRKVMSLHVSDALKIIDKYDNIFSGDERIPFVRLCIPIFVKLEQFDRAIKSLKYIHELSPNQININSLAWCYFTKKDFPNAISYALKVTTDPINSPTVGAAYPTLIYSYLYLGDVESAERHFTDFMLRFPNSATIDQVRATIENVRLSRQNPAESSFQVDAQLEAEDYIPDITSFPVGMFRTKYLKFLLDDCEFAGIRDVSVGKDGKNYYDPITVENAITKFKAVANDKETRMTDAQGVQKAVSDRNLTIAWLAQYCLDSDTSSEEQIKFASNAFLTSSAKMLIAKARSIMMGASVEVDYLRMIFSECIILLARMQTISLDDSNENLFLNIPEFYTAFNAYVLFSVSKELGTNNEMTFWRSKIDKTGSNEQFQSKRKQDLSQKTINNFKKAWDYSPIAPELLCKSFVQVLSDAGDVSEYLKPFLFECISHFELEKDSVSILKRFNSGSTFDTSIGSSIDSVFNYFVRDFNLYQGRLIASLRQATDNLINNQNPEPVRTAIFNLKKQLENPFLRSRDRAILNEVADILLEVCKMFDEDIYDTARAFSERNLQAFKQLRLEILANPTNLAFGDILPRIDSLINYLLSYIQNLTQRHLPEIEVFDDQEDEGYSATSDGSIRVQLRIRNAERKTPPSNIVFKFYQSDETRQYYYVEENPLYTELSLPGGESAIVPVKLLLTNFGKTPDTPMDLKFSVSYRTVQNQTLETEKKVITITTKSEDGYLQIDPNPYKVGGELRAGQDDAIFFGRERDIEIISNMLARGRAQGTSIAIYGQFRCGKSSLKNYVISRIEKLDPTVIVANMEIDERGNLSDFVHSLIHQICRNLNKKIIRENYNEIFEFDVVRNDTQDKYPIEFLCDFLHLLKTFVNPYHILVTIDEFGRIFSDSIPSNFMQYWKQMMSIGSIDAIVVGHDVLTQQMRENRNEFAAFSLHQLNYLPEDSAIRLIQNPIYSDTIGDRFKPDAVKYIYEMTAGNAFYIQQICFSVVNFMNDNKLNKVNANQVKVVIASWFENTDTETLNTFFHPMYMSGEKGENLVSDDDAQKILKAIAIASARRNGLASKSDILNVAEEIDNSFSPERIHRILESLESRWVIDKHDSDEYEIRVKLYQEYLLGKI